MSGTNPPSGPVRASRRASVSNISLVSVGALIGVGGLGQLFTQGFTGVPNTAPIIVGIALTLVLAFVVDLLLIGARELLTPWTRAGRARRGPVPLSADPTTRPAVATTGEAAA